MEIFGIAGFIGLIVAIFAVSFVMDRRRRRQMAELAARLHMSYAEEDSGAFMHELAGFQLFSHGRSRKITNIIRGASGGLDVAMFDYRYTTGSGKHSHTHSQSVLAFFTGQLVLPRFCLRPEQFFDKIGQVFGCDDIDFPSHPGFSGRYLLKGENEEQIRTMFSAQVLQYFEGQSGLSVEGAGSVLIFYRAGRKLPVKGMEAFLKEGFTVFGLFKAR
jgi:hypothetical protein